MSDSNDHVVIAVGELRTEVKNLRGDLNELKQSSTTEHRKVHDIVVATSESIRILARTVEEMRPPVEDYRLKAAALAKSVELTADYQEKKAEARGAAKFANALWLAVGSLFMLGVTKLSDWLTVRPHP